MPVSGLWGALGGAGRAAEEVADKRIDQINRSAYAAEREAATMKLQEHINRTVPLMVTLWAVARVLHCCNCV